MAGVACAVMPLVRIGSGVLRCPAPPFASPRPLLCSLSQRCWFSAVCLCQVCVIVEWRWCDGACSSRCLSSLPLFSPFSFSFFSSLFVLVFGVVRAQPCEHARYPRTPLHLPLPAAVSLLSSVPLPAFPRVPPFFRWNGGGGFTMCRSVRWA